MKLITLFILMILTSCATSSIKPMENTLRDGKVKFCFIGDMGLGNQTQAKVTQALKEEACHSIHMVGDLIYPSGIRSVDDPELEKKFLRHYRPISQSGHGPKFSLILGNHDHRGDIKAWQELANLEPFIIYPNPYYLQNWGGLCLVHLDSNYYKLLKDYFKGQGQISWLNSIKTYLKNQCHTTLALTHHPYRSRGPKHGNATGHMKEFLEDHIIGQFDYLISGHEHVLSDEGRVQGTRLLISGAGGNSSPNEDVGFLVLEVESENGTIKKLDHFFKRLKP